MKVWVDDQRCRGHGMCLTLCPEVFSLTDDGYAVSIESDVPTELEPATREAIECCPEQAIGETASQNRLDTNAGKEIRG